MDPNKNISYSLFTFRCLLIGLVMIGFGLILWWLNGMIFEGFDLFSIIIYGPVLLLIAHTTLSRIYLKMSYSSIIVSAIFFGALLFAAAALPVNFPSIDTDEYNLLTTLIDFVLGSSYLLIVYLIANLVAARLSSINIWR